MSIFDYRLTPELRAALEQQMAEASAPEMHTDEDLALPAGSVAAMDAAAWPELDTDWLE